MSQPVSHNPPIDLDAVRAFLADKERRRQTMLDERFAQATADFSRIVQMLVTRYAPRRVLQWGSLLNRRKFSEISDIDIAVQGIAGPKEFFALYGDAEALTQFPLHIVEMESLLPAFVEYINQYGRVIYERP